MRVLASGAGIVGLPLAPRLHQRGLTPVVVERAPRLRDGGYTLGLSDPGLDAAERMGVADALRAARRMPRRLVYVDGYVDGDGRERFAIDGPAIDRLVGARRFDLLRGGNERALCERVRGEVEVRFGASPESVEVARRHGTRLTAADGDSRPVAMVPTTMRPPPSRVIGALALLSLLAFPLPVGATRLRRGG